LTGWHNPRYSSARLFVETTDVHPARHQRSRLFEETDDIHSKQSNAETIMANTFSNIYLQFVFAVQKRKSLIPKKHKEELRSKFEIPYDGKYLFRFFD